MVDYIQQTEDYERIEQALRFLEANAHLQPSLAEVAESIHLSEYHFQRLFTRWVGISPKRFLQYLTKEYAKQLLDSSESLLETAYQVGLSGPSRLHDLFVVSEAVTPGEYKQRGEGLRITYGVHPTPFGLCQLAVTSRGVCGLSFVSPGGEAAALEELRQAWPLAHLEQDPGATAPLVKRIFDHQPAGEPLQLYLQGTNFQIKVWEALLSIPAGQVAAYEDIARWIGHPQAIRAVGNAVAHNQVAYLVPCHRVIRKMGEFGKYRYGSARKKAILVSEWAGSQVSLSPASSGVA